MSTIWGRAWPRLAATAVAFYAICFTTIWFGAPIATTIALSLRMGLFVSVNVPVSPPLLKPAFLLAIIPILPFWLAAETSPRPLGKPLPFGCYLMFGLIFFFAFFVCLYIDISENQKNAVLGIGMLIAAYLGAAIAAAAAAGAYFLLWRRLENRRPAVAPDVF